MKDMIGYCGLDCEKCDAYLATINNDQVLREKTAKLWAELNSAPILPEHINCEGCRMNGAKTVFCDSLCGIRKCALGSPVPGLAYGFLFYFSYGSALSAILMISSSAIVCGLYSRT